MGLFGQKTRKKRTAAVGIAEENDPGSFSGLEVAVHTDDSESKTVHAQESNKAKHPKGGKSKTSSLLRSKLFKSRKSASLQQHPPLSHQNHGGNYDQVDSSEGKSSDLLSVYTSSYVNESESLVALASQQSASDPPNGNDEGWVVTLDHLSDLVLDLETAVIVGAKRPLRALKMLLALSSLKDNQSSAHETRIAMVRCDQGTLVPVLLSFLNRCMVQSKEHILALLVLGNISIPQENKRVSFHMDNAVLGFWKCLFVCFCPRVSFLTLSFLRSSQTDDCHRIQWC